MKRSINNPPVYRLLEAEWSVPLEFSSREKAVAVFNTLPLMDDTVRVLSDPHGSAIAVVNCQC